MNRSRNLWYDFGVGIGGNIISLVGELFKTSNVGECLSIIEEKMYGKRTQSFSFPQQIFQPSSIKMERVQDLQHPALLNYISQRKVDVNIGKEYCKEVYYECNGKHYFAIGFPNDKNGYELLNPYFKGCMTPKDITTFCHNTENTIFCEGFMDYLSVLTKVPRHKQTDAVVLNSVNNLEKAVPFLKTHSHILSFLDNDDAGRKAFERLQEMGLYLLDISKRFAEYKDVNDYLRGLKNYGKSKAEKQEITPQNEVSNYEKVKAFQRKSKGRKL